MLAVLSASALLQTGSLAGVEVLLRSHSPELGWIPPEQFITRVEKTGLILPEERMDFRANLLEISAVAKSRTNSS